MAESLIEKSVYIQLHRNEII